MTLDLKKITLKFAPTLLKTVSHIQMGTSSNISKEWVHVLMLTEISRSIHVSLSICLNNNPKNKSQGWESGSIVVDHRLFPIRDSEVLRIFLYTVQPSFLRLPLALTPSTFLRKVVFKAQSSFIFVSILQI